MIRLATKNDESSLREIWRIIFDDSDFFIDLHYSKKYKPENTLLYISNNQIIAMLQMLPYQFNFWNESLEICYLCGLATLPAFRNKGIMSELIQTSNQLMEQRKIDLAILIPATEKLFTYYQQFDYEQVFEKEDEEIPLQKIIEKNKDLISAYQTFDKIYRTKDFCIQKTFEDFCSIIADFEQDRYERKANISAMARLIAVEKLFNIYKKNMRSNIDFILTNEEDIRLINNVLYVNRRNLCRLLFGYKTSEFGQKIIKFFPEHKPILNLMLE